MTNWAVKTADIQLTTCGVYVFQPENTDHINVLNAISSM